MSYAAPVAKVSAIYVLNHRVTPTRQAPQVIHAYRPRGWGHAPRLVQVAAANNNEEVLHAEAESDDDADGDQLAMFVP